MLTLIEPSTGTTKALCALAASIRHRHRDLIRELGILAVEGGVVLHGTAYRFYGKQVALHEVAGVAGYNVLANRIVVV